jgi:hypothetical protein
MLKFIKKMIATGGPAEPTEETSLSAASTPQPDGTSLVPPKERRDQDQILLFLVDLVDEMDALPPSSTGGKDEMAVVRSRIEDRLLLCDAELIRDETWDPERQRAVEVAEGAMDEVTPKISSSRISGLCVSGRVVRKQEVALERQ